MISLSGYLKFWAVAFVVITLYLAVFQEEVSGCCSALFLGERGRGGKRGEKEKAERAAELTLAFVFFFPLFVPLADFSPPSFASASLFPPPHAS